MRGLMKRLKLTTALAGALFVTMPAMAQQLTLVGDSYVDSTGAARGTLGSITIGGGNHAQGLLQFDTSTLPAGTTAALVGKAVLFIYIDTVERRAISR